jgi:hypothetical protein
VEARVCVLEQFKPFVPERVFEIRDAGGVAAWPRQALGKARQALGFKACQD